APLSADEVVVDPPSVRLAGSDARQTLLVHGKTASGRTTDLTGTARIRSLNPQVVAVEGNALRPRSDGAASVEVEAAGRTLSVAVTVEGSSRPKDFHFENDVEPILSRFGCNSSGCHGKAEGQNGFKLSVFGFDPDADFAALLKEGRGRRVFAAAPEHSLLLRKATGQAAHGGRSRFPVDSAAWPTPRGWPPPA